MDPITHGIIGLGIAALSGEPISFTNPVVLGSVIGAMSPDIDILVRYWGNYEYLKHHRGPTHSILGLGALTTVISIGLHLLFRDFSFTSIFIWTLFGSISHTIFDGLNSYGVRPLMPFIKRKYSGSLLMLYDPFLTVLSISLALYSGSRIVKLVIALLSLVIYITTRLYMRRKAKDIICKTYEESLEPLKVSILPSMLNLFKWDFIVETNKHNIVGQINLVNKKVSIRKKLNKVNHKLMKHLQNTRLGKYFSEFTPITHVEIIKEETKTILKVIDLRYIMKNNFMHHATITFNQEEEVVESVFQPYNLKNRIIVKEDNIA